MPRTELRSHPVAVRAWRQRRARLFRDLLRPPPKLTISEWADRCRVIPKGTSPEPGPWRTDRVPYARGIMDTLSDPRVTRVSWMAASQVCKTELCLNVVGYYIDQEPSPILVVQPSERPMGEAFSKDRLAPMLAVSPALRGKVKPARVKDSGNTMLHKVFAGGHVTIAGANSAAGLASRPIRVLVLDEIDRYPASAGSEGDPVGLAVQRTSNFAWTRKVFIASTPTLKVPPGAPGGSRINREWERSDRRRYFVPCPSCSEPQHLKWGGPEESFGIKWDKEISCRSCGVELDGEEGPCPDCGSEERAASHLPETAHYLCEHCGEAIPEARKSWMLRAGEWRVTRPGGDHPGFHLSALYSPWVTWASLAAQFLAQKDDPMELQTFVNTKLGEPFEDQGSRVDASDLEGRAEVYVGADNSPVEVPDGVGVLTAGVDVQGDRLELLVRGWGVGLESWDIAHHRIYGAPQLAETWGRLDALLARAYRHAFGREMRILAAMIDSGFETDTVYTFVRPRDARNVWASKGDTGRAGAVPLSRASRANRDGVKLWTIGTHTLKDRVFGWLRMLAPGPGYVHLRLPDPQRCNGFDAEYFAQFSSEKKVRRRVKGTREVVSQYVQTRERNEALDLHVLALAALHGLGAGVRENMAEWVEMARQPPPPPPEEPVPNREESGDWATGSGSWATGWR